jgi:hypothetical protein
MICSISESCGLRGGSCGRDSAGPSFESVMIFCNVANAVVENARVNLGRVHIWNLCSLSH